MRWIHPDLHAVEIASAKMLSEKFSPGGDFPKNPVRPRDEFYNRG